jgi:cholesterol transport system auxiliary component
MRAPNPSTALRTLAVTLAIAALAGCSVLPKTVDVQIWQPETHAVPAAHANADFTLRVDTPNATGTIDQTGIVVLPEPGEVSTYKGARWSESPALLVRHRLVDAFMAAKLPAVTTDDDHFSADYSLSGNLRAFQTEYHHGTPVVVVRFDALLRRSSSRRPFASRSFVITEQPAGAQVAQIVAAFGTADDALARDVVAWALAAVSQAPATPEPDSPTASAH